MVDKKQTETSTTPKIGCPGSLAQFRKGRWLEEPINPLPYAVQNDEYWFQYYSAYLIDRYRPKAPKTTLRILPAMEDHIRERLVSLNDTPVSRWFEPPWHDDVDPAFPRLRLTGAPCDRAVQLSRALYRLARRDPDLAREVALGYSYAATTRRRIVLTTSEDARFGRHLFKSVRELAVPGLKVMILGFTVGNEIPDLAEWLERLELSPKSETEYEPTSNQESRSALNHVGLKISWSKSGRPSREWHEVMVVAAAIELWRTVTPLPQLSYALHGAIPGPSCSLVGADGQAGESANPIVSTSLPLPPRGTAFPGRSLMPKEAEGKA